MGAKVRLNVWGVGLVQFVDNNTQMFEEIPPVALHPNPTKVLPNQDTHFGEPLWVNGVPLRPDKK